MPAARSPAPGDAVAARRIQLTGLTQDAALPDLLGELEPLRPRDSTFHGEVFRRLAAGALAWSGTSPADPLPLEGMRERFLPGYSGRGGTGASSSTRCWRPRRCTAAPNRTCSIKSPDGRPATSGGTRSSPRARGMAALRNC